MGAGSDQASTGGLIKNSHWHLDREAVAVKRPGLTRSGYAGAKSIPESATPSGLRFNS